MYRWDVHNELKDQIARKIAAELSKNNMINTEVTQSAPGYNDEYKVTAEILVIEPKPER